MRPTIGISVSTLLVVDLPGLPHHAVPDGYAKRVFEAGGVALLLPVVDAAEAPAFLERLDGLLLPGGNDLAPHNYGQAPHPKLTAVEEARDALEIALARAAHERDIPILAICRGAQVLNVALGGSLAQHVPDRGTPDVVHDQGIGNWDPLCHEVAVVPGSRLHAITGADRLEVNSFHHQAIDRTAAGLVVSARSPDGLVEGLEDPAHPYCVAVQWHPERRPDDAATREIFGTFVAAARLRQGR